MEEEIVGVPECPVCLQVFNNKDTIPRVLSCGHSACETCLPQLPQRFPDTIRCPACNQLVHFSHQAGAASSLPKNIDLLSFINQQTPNSNSNSSQSHNTQQRQSNHEFLPPFWSQEFYLNWKNSVLPLDSISLHTISLDANDNKDSLSLLLHGRISSSSSATSSTSCFREGEIVSLLYIGSSTLTDSLFNFSYTVRIMQFLNQLQDSVRDELHLILRASALLRARVCKVYGLWMNMEDGSVFIVSETLKGDFANQLHELRTEDVEEDVGVNCGMPGFAVVGMELSEALASLHSEGMVCGCLSPSCFSFDQFGRVFVKLSEVLVLGRGVHRCIANFAAFGFQTNDDSKRKMIIDDVLSSQAYISPELLLKLYYREGNVQDFSSAECSVGYFSDVWSLACILVSIILGNSSSEELFKNLYYGCLPALCEENSAELSVLYRGWVETVSSELETSLSSEFSSLHQILCRCLEYDPGSRPNVTDVWKCIRGLVIKPHVDILVSVDALGSMENIVHCLTLGNLCDMSKESDRESQRQENYDLQGSGGAADWNPNGDEEIEKDIVEGLRLGKFQSTDLQGHLDCVTGLAVGGGFLFASSFDKAVHMWSLQDFSHVQSFRGHEHRVMGVVFVDAAEPLCVSGDSGGGIYVWGIGISLQQEPLKRWYEQKDWRYSGIHALAVSGTEHIYTGSGDKSIKAWSLRDYTLMCTMNGHKSVVSSLAVCDGVLYSGSWDGTIRLWSINDHSPLTVLGDDTPGNVASVLSLSVDQHMLAAAHENGCLKLWKDDVLSTSIETQAGAIFALDMKKKWLFMGGRNKTVDVKELSGDEFHMDTKSIGSIACNSVVTALLYWEGKLFVGFADRIIKVYRYKV